jgi:hypothetical protein
MHKITLRKREGIGSYAEQPRQDAALLFNSITIGAWSLECLGAILAAGRYPHGRAVQLAHECYEIFAQLRQRRKRANGLCQR